MRANRFQIGSGCFACALCGRATRDTGEGSGTGLCSQCFNICSYDNAINDNGEAYEYTADYRAKANALLAEIQRKGGDFAKVKANNSYVWPITSVVESENASR